MALTGIDCAAIEGRRAKASRYNAEGIKDFPLAFLQNRICEFEPALHEGSSGTQSTSSRRTRSSYVSRSRITDTVSPSTRISAALGRLL